MSLTRKDFVRIAAALNCAYVSAMNDEQREGVGLAINLMADALAQTNERFDEDRFIAACRQPADPILFREDNP